MYNFLAVFKCKKNMSVNADKTLMVVFTNNRKLVGLKKPILFGIEVEKSS
jgi:hypothetical protein